MADVGDHLHKQTRGWLIPYLLQLDIIESPPDHYQGHGRWYYWLNACERGAVPEGDIPQIAFTSWPDHEDVKHVQNCLKFYAQRGVWYDRAWLAMVHWLLHGFGRRGLENTVNSIPPEVRNFWYTQFNLGILLRSPIDWSAYILQGKLPAMGNSRGRHMWAKGTGFYATPMNVTNMMVQMVFMDTDPEDAKIQTVCDPCCGTGSMLLPASNHSLRLYGQDIVADLCLCAELNGWLWMPWLVWQPPNMRRMFNALDEQRNDGHHRSPGVALETEPTRVAATEAYRNGELSQGDFFAQLEI